MLPQPHTAFRVKGALPARTLPQAPWLAPRPTPRLTLRLKAKPDDSKAGAGGDKERGNPGQADSGQGKADFSAYWSMRVREFFSARRQYLEGAKRKEIVEPDALIELGQRVEEMERQREKQRAAAREEQALVDQEALQEAAAEATRMLRPLEERLFGGRAPPDVLAQLSPNTR